MSFCLLTVSCAVSVIRKSTLALFSENLQKKKLFFTIFADGEVLVCLIVISCIVQAKSSNVQEFSDFPILNNVIEEEAVVQLDTNHNTGMTLLV